jgi:predicted HAD superfamily Cof-like phosphohydrolase
VTVVAEFHEAFGLPNESHPVLKPDAALLRLRLRLITEEYEEVVKDIRDLIGMDVADASPETRLEGLRKLLKELCDLRYVVEGAAASLGLPIEEAYREVHRSNMSKLGPGGKPIYDPGGKVMKGPNYSPADMTPFVPEILDVVHDFDDGDPC